MATTQNYRVDSFVGGLAIKAPVKTVATANIPTLSGVGATIGGYLVGAGDRVLLIGQTDPVENGIYTAETSAWNRAGDFDGNRDIVGGTIVPVWRQSMSDVVLYQVDGVPTPITVGVDSITFNLFYDPTLAGIAEAPIDGSSYVRQDAGWVLESIGSLPSPAVSSVLVGDAAGTSWIVAPNVSISATTGAIQTTGPLLLSDGVDSLSMNNVAGVLTIIGTGGFTNLDIVPRVHFEKPIRIIEQAAADSDIANFGQFWVRNDVDNVPMFTSDAGTDQNLDPSVSEINEQNGNYTTVLADKGKTIRKASGGAGETFTIADEATVNYKIGTYIAFDNDGGGTLTITIAGIDTLIFADDGSTGPRTLASGGMAVAYKNASGQWKIAGRQLT